METLFEIDYISCDICGKYAKAEEFPSPANMDKYIATMKKFSHTDSEICCNQGAGVVCPDCGNINMFDFDPNGKMLEKNI